MVIPVHVAGVIQGGGAELGTRELNGARLGSHGKDDVAGRVVVDDVVVVDVVRAGQAVGGFVNAKIAAIHHDVVVDGREIVRRPGAVRGNLDTIAAAVRDHVV